MARNLGRLRLEWQSTPHGMLGLPISVDTGERWQDYAPEKPDHVYFAVDDDGTVIAAGNRSTGLMLEGYDIWEIEGDPADYGALMGKHWDGKNLT